MDHLVSIITPTYNSEKFIAETIESIINQTCTNWELLITDDCSTDSTVEIIRSYIGKDNRIKLFKLDKNSGAGIARNNSIKEAKGRFIAFCDSDDLWKPDKLEKQIHFMLDKDISFSFSSYDVIDENGKFTGHIRAKTSITWAQNIVNDYIGFLTVIYDTEVAGKVYMPPIRKRQDWVLKLNLLKKTGHAYSLNEYLAVYRVSRNSISSNKIAMMKYIWKVYREYEHFSMIRSVCYLIRYCVVYFIKRQTAKK